MSKQTISQQLALRGIAHHYSGRNRTFFITSRIASVLTRMYVKCIIAQAGYNFHEQ